MADQFDILGGQYMDCIEHLRAAFTACASDTVTVVLAGEVKTKRKQVEASFRTRDQYLVAVQGYRLDESRGEENYANMPLPRTFTLAHIYGALALEGRPRTPDDKQGLRALITMTSEAARFRPIADTIATLIAERAETFQGLDYGQMLTYIQNYDSIRRFGKSEAPAGFQPLTAANVHNWRFLRSMQRGETSVHHDFEETRGHFAPKSIHSLNRR